MEMYYVVVYKNYASSQNTFSKKVFHLQYVKNIEFVYLPNTKYSTVPA